MRYVETAGVRLSVVGLGTWQFGAREWGYGGEYASVTAPALVQRALDLGVNLFDTAEVYGWGRSERILGAALGSRRDEAFVASKLFPLVPVSPVVEQRARASAARLGTSSLDLYQIHWPNPLVPIERTMPALARLREEGVVRNVGVSNFSLEQWQRAERALGAPVLSNQVRFNLVDRRPERELLGWARENDRLVIAYSPLAQGLLSGRYDVGHVPRNMRAATPAFLAENLERVAPLIDVLRAVSRSHDCTPAQIALAWVLHHDNVVVIPGASTLQQLEANVAAADLTLSDEEQRELAAAADAYRPIGGIQAVVGLVRQRATRVAERFAGVARGLRT